jgi:hypothetical protein
MLFIHSGLSRGEHIIANRTSVFFGADVQSTLPAMRLRGMSEPVTRALYKRKCYEQSQKKRDQNFSKPHVNKSREKGLRMTKSRMLNAYETKYRIVLDVWSKA